MSNLSPFIEQIKDRVLLSSIISMDVKLIRQGQNMGGLCPFHNEKTPSFTVNDKKGFYHCFGCGAHGDLISYMMDAKKYEFREAVDYLAAKAGIQLPKVSKIFEKNEDSHRDVLNVLDVTSLFFRESLKTIAGESARDYLEKRGLSPGTIEEFQVGFAAKSALLYEYLKKKSFSDELILASGLVVESSEGHRKNRFYERITFPILNDKAKIIAFGARTLFKEVMPKYLNSSDSDVFHKSQILYNLHRAKNFVKEQEPLIVTEGYLDVMMMHQSGIKTSVATLGTAVSEHHLQLVWRRSSKPIFCFDGDQAGYNAALRTIKVALPVIQSNKTITFTFLPNGEDPASMIQAGRVRDLQSILSKPMNLNEVIKQEVRDRLARSKTLEEKAEVKKYINELVSMIKDTDLQKLYTYDLYKEFDDIIKKLYSVEKVQRKMFSPLPSFQKKISVAKKNIVSQKILLATLINHPTLIGELHDFFIQVVFSNSEWDRMRDIMLNYDVEDESDLRETLMQHNLRSAVEDVCDSCALMHAPFAKQSVDRGVAKESWLDVWHHTVWQNEARNDFNKMKNHVKASMDEQDWQKLKIAKLNLK